MFVLFPAAAIAPTGTGTPTTAFTGSAAIVRARHDASAHIAGRVGLRRGALIRTTNRRHHSRPSLAAVVVHLGHGRASAHGHRGDPGQEHKFCRTHCCSPLSDTGRMPRGTTGSQK